jgi:hypothetical protein
MKKILLLLILGTVISAQQIMLTQDTISIKSSFNTNPFILKDSNGKIHLVYTNQSRSSGSSKEIFYSMEEADSFRTSNLTNNYIEESQPCLSFDNNDNVHITFLSKDTTNKVFQITYTNNINGYFTEPFFLTTDGINKSSPVSLISKDSIIYIVYYTYSYTTNRIYYLTYNLKTNKVSKPVSLGSGGSSGNNDIAMTLDKNGWVHIVIKEGASEGGNLKYFIVKKGILKEVPLEIAHKIKAPKLQVDRFNTVYILYKNVEDKRLYITNNLGDNFERPVAVTPPHQDPESFDNFSIDVSNRFYFAYQSADSANNTGLYLVHGNREQFSAPIRIQEFKDADLLTSSTSVLASGDGQFSILFSKVNVRDNKLVSDLILKKGFLFGNAVAKVENDSLIFKLTKIGDTSELLLKIKNSGTALLKIYSPEIASSVFSVELQDTLYIEPDTTKAIKIQFQPSDTIEYKSKIMLNTNSLTTSTIAANLFGKGFGLPEIFASKDTLILMEEKGFIDSVLIINKGTAVLTIDSIKNLSKFNIAINYKDGKIEPHDSIYIKVSLENLLDDVVEHFIDSILIFSNDPFRRINKFIIHSRHYTLNLNEDMVISQLYKLHQNYPNPFNPHTTISFTISNQAHVTLRVFDALAREIATLVDENLSSGIHNIVFNGEQLSTGVYYYKLQVKSSDKKKPDYVEVKKMILVK